MSLYDKIWLHSYCMFVGVFAVVVFLQAFFPVVLKTSHHASPSDIPSEVHNEKIIKNRVYHSRVEKTILMVIDALRVDFIDGANSSLNMPYTTSLIMKEEALVFHGRVHIPTVTMPRIKAMTTGTIPGFFDIVYNLGSSSVLEDNIVLQLEKANKTVVFYGDETWLKLFPSSFKRKEGTTSFFVSDFTEVDNNVTRNLESELKTSDWDMMILHYLGLDHIGHLEGPKSPLVKPKLLEMDTIIENIHHNMIKWKEVSGEKSLLIVCGDHGMKDSGGHGGATHAETSVPIVAVDVGRRSSDFRHFSDKEVFQIDIVPTLSVLLGLPIPKNNIGRLILQFLANIPKEKRLFALYYNTKQIADCYSKVDSYNTKVGFLKYQEAVRLHGLWLRTNNSNSHLLTQAEKLYIASLNIMSDELRHSNVDYDIYQLYTAVVILIQMCIILALANNNMRGPASRLTTSGICLCAFSFLNALYCLSTESKSSMCSVTPVFIVRNSLVLIVLSANTAAFIDSSSIFLWPQPPSSHLLSWLLAGSALHCVSLLSSSFIEEEHQVWYFLWTTFLLLLLFKQGQYSYNSGCFKLSSFSQIIAFAVIQRLLRKLNQSGDKWAHLPDMSDWLGEPANKRYLSIVLALGLLGCHKVLCVFKWLLSAQSTIWKQTDCIVTLAMLGSIYCYRSSTGAVLNFISRNTQSKGYEETSFFWLLLAVLCSKHLALWVTARSAERLALVGSALDVAVTFWVLLTALLHRPHNVLLLCVHAWGSFFLGDRYHNTFKTKDDTRWLALAHTWLGMVFYFHQGNSNSLSTIDVASGYVGLQEYNPVAVGSFLVINTFSAPVFSILLLFAQLFITAKDRGFHWLWTHTSVAVHTLICHRLIVLTLCFLLLIVQRHHLFVWSVFSPKLLYESTHSLVHFVALMLFYCFLVIAFKYCPHFPSKSNCK